MNCLLCNSSKTKQKFIYNGEDIYLDKLNIKDFNLIWYECNYCGVFFSNQYSKIDKIYEDETLYDAAYNKEEIEIRFHKIMNLNENKSDNAHRVNRCKKYFFHYRDMFNIKKNKYEILDVGAGLGVFLAKFLDNNFNGSALELNKVASNHIKKSIPSVIIYQDYMQNLNIGNIFDLITLNRVLEHIKTPIDVMQEVKKALKEKGLIYLELPDSYSYSLDSSSNEAFGSGHYMVYNSKSIEYIFNKVGLELMNLSRVKEPSGKFTIYAIGKK